MPKKIQYVECACVYTGKKKGEERTDTKNYSSRKLYSKKN